MKNNVVCIVVAALVLGVAHGARGADITTLNVDQLYQEGKDAYNASDCIVALRDLSAYLYATKDIQSTKGKEVDKAIVDCSNRLTPFSQFLKATANGVAIVPSQGKTVKSGATLDQPYLNFLGTFDVGSLKNFHLAVRELTKEK